MARWENDGFDSKLPAYFPKLALSFLPIIAIFGPKCVFSDFPAFWPVGNRPHVRRRCRAYFQILAPDNGCLAGPNDRGRACGPLSANLSVRQTFTDCN